MVLWEGQATKDLRLEQGDIEGKQGCRDGSVSDMGTSSFSQILFITFVLQSQT